MTDSCDICAYVESLMDKNRRLNRVVGLQIETIKLLQEHNEQLVSALDQATRLMLAQNPDNAIARQLRNCL